MNFRTYILAALLLMLTGCSDAIDTIFGGGIEEGDAVAFTTLVPDVKHDNRSAKEEWQGEINAYKAVNREYAFDIEMWKQGDKTAAAQSTYRPIVSDGGVYHSDGTLQNVAQPLYWQDNVSRWGFRATAGTATLDADQTSQTKWLAQDRLVGYSYLPIWNGSDDDGNPTDNLNAINYRTSKQWYADNKTAKDLSGLMVESTDDYKKVPLFLQHQRSWVTIILKAGEGVEREALAYASSAKNLETTIYSYPSGGGQPLPIQAWVSEELINYDADKNGPAATNVSTTRYDAIVEPHNFIASPTTQEQDIIARINVSDQKFTFAAANDFRYGDFLTGNAAATEAMQAYNLLPGKHLTITATLTRDSRLIFITAWIEDWTETVTQTICDDYGQNGNPYLINTEAELKEFLDNPEKNKAGNVAVIVPNVFPALSEEWDASKYTLNATLNLANSRIQLKEQFVKNITRAGSIVNGEFFINDAFHDKTTIATTNMGSIERVRITTSGDLSSACATVAGLVETNYGNIYQCSSVLPVKGTGTSYVGGIAAQNLQEAGVDVQPTIESCTVVARVDRVDGDAQVIAGGGIVGRAEGRVSNNTFEYGITLLQGSKFQNIIGAVGSNGLQNHANNSWPTMAQYTLGSTTIYNANTGTRYDAVIDSQDELKELLKSSYNISGKIYRIANSFAVSRDTWIWGSSRWDEETKKWITDDAKLNDEYFSVEGAQGDYNHGLVRFTLNGNDKTIYLTGSNYATMLFGSVIGEVYDLNLVLERPLVAERILSENANRDDTNTDAIAAFAYAVTVAGTAKGSIRNIHLSGLDGTYIQASTPGGIAVWASHGGELTNCTSDVPVLMHLTVEGSDARHYAGGIVACVQKATITHCKYYADNGVGWATDDSDNIEKAQKSNCRYGGIVGGTTEIPNTNDTPELVLSECYSWWDLPNFSDEVTPGNRPVMGSLIGSTVYHDPAVATRLYNAMAEGNAGNWWTGITGAGMLKSGVTEEQAIGRKNGVVPSKE